MPCGVPDVCPAPQGRLGAGLTARPGLAGEDGPACRKPRRRSKFKIQTTVSTECISFLHHRKLKNCNLNQCKSEIVSIVQYYCLYSLYCALHLYGFFSHSLQVYTLKHHRSYPPSLVTTILFSGFYLFDFFISTML